MQWRYWLHKDVGRSNLIDYQHEKAGLGAVFTIITVVVYLTPVRAT